jgi:hypothetical protein
MLVRENNVAKHAAVLQCIAHDFRELSEHHPDQSEALSGFASPQPRLPARPAHNGVNGHHVA